VKLRFKYRCDRIKCERPALVYSICTTEKRRAVSQITNQVIAEL